VNKDNVNRLTATAAVNTLHPGVYLYADWFGRDKAIAVFSDGFARDTVADFGLSSIYNSGRRIDVRITVTGKQLLRALRRLQRAD